MVFQLHSFEHFAWSNVDADKNDQSLKWLERMKGDPNKSNKSKYCRFHHDHGHATDECYDLKQQIWML